MLLSNSIHWYLTHVLRPCVLYYLRLPRMTSWLHQVECADAQSDLSFRWAHISEGTFSHVVAELHTIAADRLEAGVLSHVKFKLFLKFPFGTTQHHVAYICLEFLALTSLLINVPWWNQSSSYRLPLIFLIYFIHFANVLLLTPFSILGSTGTYIASAWQQSLWKFQNKKWNGRFEDTYTSRVRGHGRCKSNRKSSLYSKQQSQYIKDC